MAAGKALNGTPYAGYSHVRLDEGASVSATPRRGALLEQYEETSWFGMKPSGRFLCLVVPLLALVGLASASDATLAPFDEDTAAFLPFSDHANGTHFYLSDAPDTARRVYNIFTNAVTSESFNMGLIAKTTGGLYVTNEIPGRYIFPSKNAKAPIAVDPCGIYHEGTVCLVTYGTTQLFSNLSEYTVEFFCKIKPFGGTTRIGMFFDPAPGDNKQRPIIWLPANPLNGVRLQNLGSEAPGPTTTTDVVYDDRTKLADGQWHHFAVVYKSEWGGVKLYCDYTRESEVVHVTPTATQNSGEMRIGDLSNEFPGITSVMRISKKALSPDGFMRASDDPSGTEEQTAILYPFTEDEVGREFVNVAQSAEAVGTNTAFKGYTDTETERSVVTALVKGTGKMRVEADAPGRYLYRSLTAVTPIATGLKSLRNVGDWSIANYGVISLSRASTRIATMPKYTLEFFFKVHQFHSGAVLTYWEHAKPNSNNDHRYVSEIVNASTLRYYSIITNVMSPRIDTAYPASLADGKWHHAAYVYDESAGGLNVYFDYKPVARDPLPVERVAFSSGAEWRLCSYNFDGSFSAARVTRAALTPDRFMYASDSPDGPLPRNAVAWRLDGTVGGAVSTAANSAELGSSTNLYVFNSSGVASGAGAASGTVTYSVDTAVPMARRIEGGMDGGKNVTSAAIGAGGVVASSGYGPLVAHAYAFTAQAYVKADSLPANGAFAALVGRTDTANGHAWCLALDAAGQIVLKAKLAKDDGTCEDLTCATGVALGQGWHHVAVTCDALTRTFTVYRDYVAIGTATAWAYPLLMADGGITVGDGCGMASLDGLVDEVVFTRDLLAPADFIRFKVVGTLLLFK